MAVFDINLSDTGNTVITANYVVRLANMHHYLRLTKTPVFVHGHRYFQMLKAIMGEDPQRIRSWLRLECKQHLPLKSLQKLEDYIYEEIFDHEPLVPFMCTKQWCQPPHVFSHSKLLQRGEQAYRSDRPRLRLMLLMNYCRVIAGTMSDHQVFTMLARVVGCSDSTIKKWLPLGSSRRINLHHLEQMEGAVEATFTRVVENALTIGYKKHMDEPEEIIYSTEVREQKRRFAKENDDW